MTLFSSTGRPIRGVPLWLDSSLSLLTHSDVTWMLHEEALQEPDPDGLGDLLLAIDELQKTHEAPGFATCEWPTQTTVLNLWRRSAEADLDVAG